jgi:ribosomal protein S18 acetylase RimI-like enzyme
MENNIKVRKVIREDSRRVWEIRNHPEARKISNNTEEIPFEKHNPWFDKKYFTGQDNYCYVLEDKNNKVIGYCRFDIDEENNNYITSIAVDFDAQGKGMGSFLLKHALEMMGSKKEIVAQTFKKNIPSTKIFQKNNFEIFKEDNNNNYLKYKKYENFRN